VVFVIYSLVSVWLSFLLPKPCVHRSIDMKNMKLLFLPLEKKRMFDAQL